jgi:hypothetical protein
LAEVPKAHLALLVLLEQQVLELLVVQVLRVLLGQQVPQVPPVLLEQPVRLGQPEALVLLAVLALLAQLVHMVHQQQRSALLEEEVILVLSERQVLLVQVEAVEQ